MKGKYFSIGEVARIKGVTKKALRFYEQIGLLLPFYVDPANHYRYYHINQMLQIDVIKAARSLDISPIDLIPFFKYQDTDGLIKLLQMHGEKIQNKISELQGVLTSIENIQNNIHDAKVSATLNDVYKKEVPERYIITLPFDKSATPEKIQNDYSKLDILVDQINGIATFESGVLFELYENEAIPNYIYTTIAKPVSHPSCQLIAKGCYICVCYDKQNAIAGQEDIMKYIMKHNLTPKGVVQVELLSNLFPSDDQKWELQILI
jgi:DNA-binding transcriptional MerR regulator